jgi:hypothetical protein
MGFVALSAHPPFESRTQMLHLLSGDERHIGGGLTLFGQQRRAVYLIALRELVAIGFLTEEAREVLA